MRADDPSRVPHRENRFRGSDSLRGRCPIVIKKNQRFLAIIPFRGVS